MPRRWRCGTGATRSSRSACSASPARRPTTARTSRSTGGTSTPCPATPGTAGATTTRRRRSRTTTCIAENGRRGKLDPEYELLDTGVFDDDRYWIVEVDYAKADPTDLLMTVRVTNAGPDADTLHVLPTAWFRNTWSWDVGADEPAPRGAGADGAIAIDHPFLGELELLAGAGPGRRRADAAVLRERDERPSACTASSPARRTRRTASTTTSSAGAPPSTPTGDGTKAALWYQVRRRAGRHGRAAAAAATRAARSRPRRRRARAATSTRSSRSAGAEADEFYAELTPAGARPTTRRW